MRGDPSVRFGATFGRRDARVGPVRDDHAFRSRGRSRIRNRCCRRGLDRRADRRPTRRRGNQPGSRGNAKQRRGWDGGAGRSFWKSRSRHPACDNGPVPCRRCRIARRGRLRVVSLAYGAGAPTPPEETAQPERCRSAGVAEGGSGGSGAKPPRRCFLREIPTTFGQATEAERSSGGQPSFVAATRMPFALWRFHPSTEEPLHESGKLGRVPNGARSRGHCPHRNGRLFSFPWGSHWVAPPCPFRPRPAGPAVRG